MYTSLNGNLAAYPADNWSVPVSLLLTFAVYGKLHTRVTCPGDFWHNSDPTIAMSTESITYLSDHPDLNLPISRNFDPNQLSMQQLCAWPTDGGSPHMNMGGYCRASIYNDTHCDPLVVFITSPGWLHIT